jgi:hypothetical protein
VSDAVAVLLLDAQLGALAWSLARAAPGARLGAISADGRGGALRRAPLLVGLRERGLIAGELSADSEQSGSSGALSVAGALDQGLGELGWDAAVLLTEQGEHGEQEQSDLAMRCAEIAGRQERDTLLVAEMRGAAGSSPQQLSERTLTLLDKLQEPVSVALPAGIRSPVGHELRAGLRSVFESSARGSQLALGVDRPARIARHDWRRAPIDLVGFAREGLLEDGTRTLLREPLLFASALAAGSALADLLREEEWV